MNSTFIIVQFVIAMICFMETIRIGKMNQQKKEAQNDQHEN